MKLTGILLLAGVLHVSAGTKAQTVTYSARDISLARILTVIQQQTGFNIFYDEADLEGSSPVTVQLQSTPLREALEQVLAGQPLQFNIQGNTIFVTKKALPPLPPDMPPPHLDIRGVVTDSTGAPLSGVNVMIKGNNRGTFTGTDGTFYLKNVPANATLIFSNVGYRSQEVRINGRSEFRIVLHIEVTSMADIVINKGYYKTTDKLNTGDVTKVSGDDLRRQPIIDPIVALEGRVPGLYIQQSSGIPGSNPIVQLRGQNSIQNGNDPLYIVDGVPISSSTLTSPNTGGGAVGYSSTGQGLSPFTFISPSNIESIEVLKDADATAIYGSRGANGVILITTKMGKPGKTHADLNLIEGISHVGSKMQLMNTPQYLAMRREAFKSDGKLPSATDDYDVNGVWDTTRYTDWQQTLIGRNAQFTNLQASLTGGNVNTQFSVDGSYTRQTLVFPGTFADQTLNTHLSLNHVSLNQKFHASLSAIYTHDNSNLPQVDFASKILLAPDAPAMFNKDGSVNWALDPTGVQTWDNPFSSTKRFSKAYTDDLLGSITLSYQILPGLELKSHFGYEHKQMNQTLQQPASVYYGPPNPGLRLNYLSIGNNISTVIDPQLNYQGHIGRGKLTALLVMSYQEQQYNSIAYSASGFSSDALIGNPSFATYFSLLGSDIVSQYRYAALRGQLNYSWEDKYIINLTGNRDGSSRFGPGREFGNFWAIGAAWIFSEEKWIAKNLPWLTLGKLRGSYGTTGNDQIGDYQYMSTYSAFYNPYYQGVSTLWPTALSNPLYSWEVTKKLEGAIELGFLKNRVTTTFAYFRNRCGDQLVGESLPYTTGSNRVTANLPALLQNSGIEVMLNTTNIRTKSFSWTSNFNISLPYSKLLAYPGLASSFNAYYYAIGKPFYLHGIYHYTGVDPQTGLYTFQDVNKDGMLNNSDREFLKGPHRNYYGGLTNTFSLKGWQLSLFFYFVKQTGTNYLGSFPFPGAENENELTVLNSFWKGPGDHTNVQRFTTTGGTTLSAFRNFTSSDAIYSDASFIRLKTLELSYQLPQTVSQKMHIQDFRVFLRAQNLFTLTHYEGLDPETQTAAALPPLRTVTAGLTLSL